MINILTEEQFLKKVKNKSYKKQLVKDDFIEKLDSGCCFYEIPKEDIQFICLDEMNLLIVFSEKDVQVDNEELDYTNWILEETTKEIPKEYTINCFKRICEFRSGIKDFTGSWKLLNTVTGEVFEFSTRTTDKYWVETCIAFPEKLEGRVDRKLIERKTYFIESIIHGLRKDDQGSDIES